MNTPTDAQLAKMKAGAVLVSMMMPAAHPELVETLAKTKVTGLALDAVPRISRAQSLDVLSTMSNVAGYRAVIEAAESYGGMFTGQVTAAGKTAPAHVFVIGAGVAGLAAIGAAVSLGAEVRAFDVRPEVGEQIESMGAAFVQAEAAQQEVSSDGYAKALTEEQERLTAEMYAAESAKADVVITTALVRGTAPRTISADMVAAMKPGSVIVDLAASGGGNCELTVPGKKIVTDNGVTIIGYTDLTSRMPQHTSQLFGTNIVNLMKLLTPGQGRRGRPGLGRRGGARHDRRARRRGACGRRRRSRSPPHRPPRRPRCRRSTRPRRPGSRPRPPPPSMRRRVVGAGGRRGARGARGDLLPAELRRRLHGVRARGGRRASTSSAASRTRCTPR